MANIIATGAQFAFATTYGAAVNVTAATNAANAVLTLAAGHGTVVGDFVEIASSGWGRAEGRVFRASVVSTNDVTFEGLDTTDTSLFPAGGAVGSSVRRITAWTSITQVGREIQITGNELETGDATYISDLVRKNVVLFRAPTNVTLPIFFDPSLSGRRAHDLQRVRVVLRRTDHPGRHAAHDLRAAGPVGAHHLRDLI
jgi:hypothetical protein